MYESHMALILEILPLGNEILFLNAWHLFYSTVKNIKTKSAMVRIFICTATLSIVKNEKSPLANQLVAPPPPPRPHIGIWSDVAIEVVGVQLCILRFLKNLSPARLHQISPDVTKSHLSPNLT